MVLSPPVRDRRTGTRLVLLPDDARLAALPRAEHSFLPAELDLTGEAPPMPGRGLRGERIVGAWTDQVDVVVLLADGARYTLPHNPQSAASGHGWGVRLPARAIAADGSRLFYVENGGLVVLTVDEPDPASHAPRAHVGFEVLDGAWTPGDEGIVLVGEHERLYVDITTGTTRRLTERAPGGYYQLAIEDQAGTPVPMLSTWSARAKLTGRQGYPLPIAGVVGPTYSSLSGWATAAVRPSTEAILPATLPRALIGVVAVSGDSPNRKELLIDSPQTDAQVRCPGCVAPVGWASGSEVLVRLRGTQDQLVRWNTITGQLSRESTIVGGDAHVLAVMSAS